MSGFITPGGSSAVAAINRSFAWPTDISFLNGTFTVANRTAVDAAGEYDCFVFQAREAMAISHVALRVGAAGSPTADLRIETVGTDGLPSGALWATNTNIVTATLVTNTWAIHALTATASIAAGQIFAVKIAYASGTTVAVATMSGVAGQLNFPYAVLNTGTPTKGAVTAFPCLALGSSTTAFYQLERTLPITANPTTTTFNNTNSAQRGLRFQLPFKARCVGIQHYPGTAVGDFNANILSEAGDVLATIAVDGDQYLNTTGGASRLFFGTPVTLSSGVWYRAAIEPTSATNCSLAHVVLASLNYRLAWPGGPNLHHATFASGSWTDTATDQVPLLDILIDALLP